MKKIKETLKKKNAAANKLKPVAKQEAKPETKKTTSLPKSKAKASITKEAAPKKLKIGSAKVAPKTLKNQAKTATKKTISLPKSKAKASITKETAPKKLKIDSAKITPKTLKNQAKTATKKTAQAKKTKTLVTQKQSLKKKETPATKPITKKIAATKPTVKPVKKTIKPVAQKKQATPKIVHTTAPKVIKNSVAKPEKVVVKSKKSTQKVAVIEKNRKTTDKTIKVKIERIDQLKTDDELKKTIQIESVDQNPMPTPEQLLSVLVPAKKKREVGRPRKNAQKQPKSTEPESPQFLTTNQEKSIIKKVQDGEVGAFEQLVNAYKQKAFYVALNLVKNHEDALDLAQDAFVKAFKAIKSFDLEAAFFPWFYKIIRNHCLNHIKKNQRIRNDSLQEIEEETYQQFQDTKPKPRDQYHTDETCNLLWKAIECLKPDFREIIQLKHFHNLSYKEIAEALNIPIGTVMSRLFNARQELRDLVKRSDS